MVVTFATLIWRLIPRAEGIGVRQMPVIKVSSDPDLVDHQFGRSQAQVGKALFRPFVVDIEAQDITVET